MSDDVQIPVTTEDAVIQTPEPVAPTSDAPPIAPAATVSSWQDELDKTDAKSLRSHPKIAGIIGSEIQRAIQLEKQRIATEEGARAAKEAGEHLRKLAQDDPVAFAEEWLTKEQQADIQSQIDNLKGQTRHEFATSIGRAYSNLPEWGELSDADHDTLARAMIGKSEDEVIPIFTHKALDIVAEKRARKLLEQWKAKELPKEREALRQEEAARMLKTSESPDITPSKGLPAKSNVNELSDVDFEKYWKSKFG